MSCWIEPSLLRTFYRRAVGYGSGGGAVAVDAVCPGAEHHNIFSGNLLRAVKSKVLVASAAAGVGGHFYRDLAAGDNAGLGRAAPQNTHTVQQVISRAGKVPIVTG